MNSTGPEEEHDQTNPAKQENTNEVIAVNSNPAANNNIRKQLSEMNEAEKQKAGELPNQEITDGEDG